MEFFFSPPRARPLPPSHKGVCFFLSPPLFPFGIPATRGPFPLCSPWDTISDQFCPDPQSSVGFFSISARSAPSFFHSLAFFGRGVFAPVNLNHLSPRFASRQPRSPLVRLIVHSDLLYLFDLIELFCCHAGFFNMAPRGSRSGPGSMMPAFLISVFFVAPPVDEIFLIFFFPDRSPCVLIIFGIAPVPHNVSR